MNKQQRRDQARQKKLRKVKANLAKKQPGKVEIDPRRAIEGISYRTAGHDAVTGQPLYRRLVKPNAEQAEARKVIQEIAEQSFLQGASDAKGQRASA